VKKTFHFNLHGWIIVKVSALNRLIIRLYLIPADLYALFNKWKWTNLQAVWKYLRVQVILNKEVSSTKLTPHLMSWSTNIWKSWSLIHMMIMKFNFGTSIPEDSFQHWQDMKVKSNKLLSIPKKLGSSNNYILWAWVENSLHGTEKKDLLWINFKFKREKSMKIL